MGRPCSICGTDRDDHEVVLGQRWCDLVMLKDRPLGDGSGRTITVEGFERDLPRTRANNLRMVRRSRSPWPDR